jgi:hypothetical protein
MFKFLLILFLIVYVVYKVGGLFFRAGAASQQQFRNAAPRRDGTINMDSIPKKENRKNTINGGDYIDYEEVKK